MSGISRGIAIPQLCELGKGWVLVLDAGRCAGKANPGQTGANTILARYERGSSGRAALFGVISGEQHAFLGDAVNVGGGLYPIMPKLYALMLGTPMSSPIMTRIFGLVFAALRGAAKTVAPNPIINVTAPAYRVNFNCLGRIFIETFLSVLSPFLHQYYR